MQKNTVKESLRAGKCVYGTAIELAFDPEMAVLLGAADWDCFFVDTEHGPVDYHQIQALCRTGRASGMVPLVRVTENFPHLITRALDAGAMGIIVPRVQDPTGAQTAVDAMKYPPDGTRGFGMRPIIHDFQMMNPVAETAAVNRETLAVLQIESREGVEAVKQIAAARNLDVLFVGPYDLTISMGIPGDFHNPAFWSAVDRVIAACEAKGVAAGIYFSDIDLLLEARNRGVRFLLYANDVTVLLEGYRRVIARLRDGRTTCSPAITR